MIGFLVQAAFTAAGLWLADLILPGVTVTNTTTLIIAALLLGVVNAIVRPILVVLTLPITIVTLGLFLLVINGLMVGLVALVLDGFVVTGAVAAILAAIIISLTSWVGSMIIPKNKR
jgi:putative membrane protein